MASVNEKSYQSTSGRSPEEIAQLKERLRDTYSTEYSTINQDAIEDEQKEKAKVHFITRAMAEDFNRENVLYSSFRETIIYILFVCAYCVHVCSLKGSNMFYMNQAIQRGFLSEPFESAAEDAGHWTGKTYIVDIKFNDISSIPNMWQYISNVFINSIYFGEHDREASTTKKDVQILSIFHDNVILGVPRIRQVRVRADSCAVHPHFNGLFKKCYGAYNWNNRDDSDFGLGLIPAWVYSSKKQTRNSDIVGKVATYDGGGYYMDLSLDGEKASEEIEELKKNHWITRHTRAVILELTIYNVNLNFFGSCKILFELPPTGGVIPTYKFSSHILQNVNSGATNFKTVCETISYMVVLFQMLMSLREMIYFKLRYFKRFWSYIDCTIYALVFTTFMLNTRKRSSFLIEINNVKDNPTKYGSFDHLFHVKAMHDDLSAVTLFFVIMRLFVYLNFNRTMGQLNDTLKKCALDVMWFLVMFFIIFLAYAELGFLLFGSQVESFHTFGFSVFTLLRTILGDFNYHEIEEANRIMAPIFFLSYIVLVFFVLLNMFLAIINDTYADVETEIALAPKELQMIEYLKQKFIKLLHKLRIKKFQPKVPKSHFTLAADEIRKALEDCGFSYLEIEMFFARYNINPAAMVKEYDATKLINELECMMPGGVTGNMDSEGVQHIKELLEHKQQIKDMGATMVELSARIDSLIYILQKIKKTRTEGKKD